MVDLRGHGVFSCAATGAGSESFHGFVGRLWRAKVCIE
jgi:hypothetical protein